MTLWALSHGTKLSTSPQPLLSLWFTGTPIVDAIVSVTWRECQRCYVVLFCSLNLQWTNIFVLSSAHADCYDAIVWLKINQFAIGDHSLRCGSRGKNVDKFCPTGMLLCAQICTESICNRWITPNFERRCIYCMFPLFLFTPIRTIMENQRLVISLYSEARHRLLQNVSRIIRVMFLCGTKMILFSFSLFFPLQAQEDPRRTIAKRTPSHHKIPFHNVSSTVGYFHPNRRVFMVYGRCLQQCCDDFQSVF